MTESTTHTHRFATPCHEGAQGFAQTYTECDQEGCDAVYVRCSCGNEYWI